LKRKAARRTRGEEKKMRREELDIAVDEPKRPVPLMRG
jgi:hypothetical protein